MKWIVGVLGVCLSLSVTAAGHEITTSPSAVDKLIEQLADPDHLTRERASDALRQMGVPALPALRAARLHADLEVRRRVEQLLPALEHAELLSPKRVTLRLKQQPLKAAIDQITQQTGYKFQLSDGRANLVYDFEFDNQPFWEVLDSICDQTGLVLQQGGNDAFYLYTQDYRVPYVCHNGPFRLVASGFYYNRNINFATVPRQGDSGGQRSEYLQFSFGIGSEPRLPLVGLGQPQLTVALDDRGNSMLPAQNHNHTTHYQNYSGSRNYFLQTQVQLVRPSQEAETMKLVKGTLPVLLLAKQKPLIEVEKVLTVKDKKFEAGKISLNITSAQQVNGQYEVSMSIQNGAAQNNQHDYFWSNSLYQRLELQDAKGNKYQSYGWNSMHSGPNSVTGMVLFGNPNNGPIGPPDKLIYYDWETLQHYVPFEFKNLPLP
ncbi:MAG: HEAT repeat domain-containing protein [Gemmataceae bacterium]